MVFGNELCGILKENAEPIKAMSNPFSFDPNKALGELHSHLFCPNCIEDYQGQETITKTSCCNIAFHESCLKEHMEMTEHAKCPMCRTTLQKPGRALQTQRCGKRGATATSLEDGRAMIESPCTHLQVFRQAKASWRRPRGSSVSWKHIWILPGEGSIPLIISTTGDGEL